MARLALAASVLLSLFLLSPAHRLPSDLATEAEPIPTVSTEFRDAAAIRLPSDKHSEESVASVSRPEATVETVDLLPAADAVVETQAVPIDVSLVPIRRDFPQLRPRVVGRAFWRRLGRHCHHMRRGPHGGFTRGEVIPYGDDMIVSDEQVRRGFEGGRYFAERFHPMMREEIPAEELARQREMGFPHEMRSFPSFRPHRGGNEGERGLVKRFLDLLNDRH